MNCSIGSKRRILRSFSLLFLMSIFLAAALAASPKRQKFLSAHKSIEYEVQGDESTSPLLILLHGASGPDAPLYRHEAEYFAANGYTVLMLHYFDASGSSAPSDQNYLAWVQAVNDLILNCQKSTEWSTRKIVLLGFSLGASVALAAGSQRSQVSAIADWYGSLPDTFFNHLKGMPPLLILHGERDEVIPVTNARQLVRLCGIAKFTCESHLYPDQYHGFTEEALRDAEHRTLDFFSRNLK